MAEHHLPLATICYGLPMAALEALLEARSARLNPGKAVGYLDRAVMAARAEMRAYIMEHYEILPNP